MFFVTNLGGILVQANRMSKVPMSEECVEVF